MADPLCKKMKKYYLLFFVAVLIIGGFLYQNSNAAERSTSVTRHQCQTATTSPTYFTAGAASSTCVIDITTVKNADLHVFMIASTSVAQLNLSVYESYDELDAITNWFGVHSSSAGVYSPSPTINSVLGNTVSSSTPFIIPLNNLRGNRLKLEYTMASTTAILESDNGAVYLELIKDNN